MVTRCCILFHFYIKPQLCSHSQRPQNVVSYSISTSNHNRLRFLYNSIVLYLIPFLHQTTTLGRFRRVYSVLYLIPFLHQTTTFSFSFYPFFLLYLIPFLHQTTTRGKFPWFKACCILFHFYIKPQLSLVCQLLTARCILFHFYIKPQPFVIYYLPRARCILFHFYIKPQPLSLWMFLECCCILFHFYIKPQLQKHP